MDDDERLILQALLRVISDRIVSVHTTIRDYEGKVARCIQEIKDEIEAVRKEHRLEAAQRREERLEETYAKRHAAERRRAWAAVWAVVWAVVGAALVFLSQLAGLWRWLGG